MSLTYDLPCCYDLAGAGKDWKVSVQNFTPSDYKAGIQNIDFTQNRDMHLFVANNLGVLSYNGSDWDVHAVRTGKKHRSLVFDEKYNRLYSGSQGEFGYFEDNWTYNSLVDLIPATSRNFDEVWDVFIHRDKVYFCTFHNIYVYNQEAISVISSPGGFDRSFQVGGRLFTQNKQGQLFEIDELQLDPIVQQTERNRTVAGVVPQGNGYLIFYNSGHIEFSSAQKATSKHKQLEAALQGTYVNHVLQLSDRRLVISTQREGLFLYDIQLNSWERITTSEGLQSNACLRTFQDYAGNLWVGLQSGISLIHTNSPMRLVNQEVHLEGSGYEALESEDGVYFTTSNGIYYLSNADQNTTFLRGTEGPSYGLREIAGLIYAGHHNGLYLLNGKQAELIANINGLWQIKHLQSNPKYVLGGTYSGLHLFAFDENQRLKSLGPLDGFNESSRFFEEVGQDRIVVSQYYKGLYQLKLSDNPADLQVREVHDTPSTGSHEQIILGKIDSDLFVATNKGLYKLDKVDGLVEVPILSDLVGSQPVYLIKQDRYKNIHVIAENMAGFFKQISHNNYSFVPSSLFQFKV